MIKSAGWVLSSGLVGYAGIELLNRVQGKKNAEPFVGMLYLGGCVLAEKLFYRMTREYISANPRELISQKKMISFGLAIFTTEKVMQAAGWVLPNRGVTLWGVASGAILAGYFIKAQIDEYKKPLRQRLEDLNNSTVFSNKIYTFDLSGQNYDIRIIRNPAQKEVSFQPSGIGNVSSCDPVIVACNVPIPEPIKDLLITVFGCYALFTIEMNNTLPLVYTASPKVC